MSTFLDDNYFNLFKTFIYEESGIHFSSTNRCILESRLKERLKISGLKNLQDYYNLIRSNQNEMKTLLDSVTTNLTRFFRNTAHFNTLENYVVPDFTERKLNSNDRTLRIWSAGCSTGEEPYTIAMVLKEKLDPAITPLIIASDLSLKSLMTAKEGFYPESRIGGIPEDYLNKYFEKKRDGYQVTNAIKSIINFDYHNLKFDSKQRNLDIVFCRNVIIYFDGEAQNAVINRFWSSMNNYSYLFIGHSESLFGMHTKFEFVKTEWSTLYKKNLDKE
jgi:chemotaxis protein methyltransferase CheR